MKEVDQRADPGMAAPPQDRDLASELRRKRKLRKAREGNNFAGVLVRAVLATRKSHNRN
jgi:hypothetical protein